MPLLVDFSDPGNFVALLIGVVILVKKLAEMDRYFELRVLILTLLFGCFVLYFYFTYSVDPAYYDCVPEHFCMTEV